MNFLLGNYIQLEGCFCKLFNFKNYMTYSCGCDNYLFLVDLFILTEIKMDHKYVDLS